MTSSHTAVFESWNDFRRRRDTSFVMQTDASRFDAAESVSAHVMAMGVGETAPIRADAGKGRAKSVILSST